MKKVPSALWIYFTGLLKHTHDMPCTVGVELNCLKNIGTELILPFLNHTTERSCLETWLSLHWIKLFQQTLYHCHKPGYIQIVSVYNQYILF